MSSKFQKLNNSASSITQAYFIPMELQQHIYSLTYQIIFRSLGSESHRAPSAPLIREYT